MKRLLLLIALLLPMAAYGQQPAIRYVDGEWKDGATTYVPLHKFGRNPDVDTGTDPEDMIDWGGLYGGFAITNWDTVLIVSSSTADTINGTGARTYTVVGLDSNCFEVTISDTLFGTTADTVSFNMYRVFRAFVTSAGSGGTNAGNITIKTPKDSILAYIAAGFGQTEQAVYTVPADYEEAFLVSHYTTNDKGPGTAGNVLYYLQMRPQNGAWRTIETFGSSTDQPGHTHSYAVPTSIPACADIRLRVQEVTQSDTQVSGGFDLWLIK